MLNSFPFAFMFHVNLLSRCNTFAIHFCGDFKTYLVIFCNSIQWQLANFSKYNLEESSVFCNSP